MQCFDKLNNSKDTQSYPSSQVSPNFVAVASNTQDLEIDSQSSALPKATNTASDSSIKITQESESGKTCEPLADSQGNSLSQFWARLVRTAPEPILKAKDLQAIALDFGGKDSESFKNANPQLFSGKTPQGVDIPREMIGFPLLEPFFGHLSPAGIVASGNPLELASLERHTKETGFSLLPTPLTCSSDSESYRRPGRDRLEMRLIKELSFLPGMVSDPEIREWMLGLLKGSTLLRQAVGGVPILSMVPSAPPKEVSQTEAIASPPSETVAPHSNQPSAGSTLITSRDALNLRWGADGVARGNCAGLNIWAVAGVPEDLTLPGVRDSKATKAHHRASLIELIRSHCVIGLGAATPQEIDELGIDQAEELAVSRAIAYLQAQGYQPSVVMGDLSMPNLQVSSKREKSADAVYLKTSAASIAAKHALDLYWARVSEHYPDYGFAMSAGYATEAHKAAISHRGLIAQIHRFSYAPCQEKAAAPTQAQCATSTAASQINTEEQYTMVATFPEASAQTFIDVTTALAETLQKQQAANASYSQQKADFKKRGLTAKSAEVKTAEREYELESKRIKALIGTLQTCQSLPVKSAVVHPDKGDGTLEGFLIDDRNTVMAVVDFKEIGAAEVSPHHLTTDLKTEEKEIDFSGFPHSDPTATLQIKRSLAIEILDRFFLMAGEMDAYILQQDTKYTKLQRDWVKKNCLTKEGKRALSQRIAANPLPLPIEEGDELCDRSGKSVGVASSVTRKSFWVQDKEFSWEDFEVLGWSKAEVGAESQNVEESDRSTEVVGETDNLPEVIAQQEVETEKRSEVLVQEPEESTEARALRVKSEAQIAPQQTELDEWANKISTAYKENLALLDIQADTESDSPSVEVVASSDAEELAHLETEIEQIQKSAWQEIGERLLRIREAKLYKAKGYLNWGSYCRDRWGYAKSQANDLIGAIKAQSVLTGSPVVLTSINQAIPIRKLVAAGVEPEKIRGLVEEVAKTGELSKEKIEQAAQEKGLLTKRKRTKPADEVAAFGQELGLNGGEVQQLPDIKSNGDTPEIAVKPLTDCITLNDVIDAIVASPKSALEEFMKLGWRERGQLRELCSDISVRFRVLDSEEFHVGSMLTHLELADKDCKIEWLESEVIRLTAENQELRNKHGIRHKQKDENTTVEWYTPEQPYIEMVREVFGGQIDTDPASNDFAQTWIQAWQYFTKDTDGLANSDKWEGFVFCNPPYGNAPKKWLREAINLYQSGRIKGAIFLINRTGSNWFRTVKPELSAICQVHQRIKFINQDGQAVGSPMYDNDFLCIGEAIADKFTEVFSGVGDVTVIQKAEQLAA